MDATPIEPVISEEPIINGIRLNEMNQETPATDNSRDTIAIDSRSATNIGFESNTGVIEPDNASPSSRL